MNKIRAGILATLSVCWAFGLVYGVVWMFKYRSETLLAILGWILAAIGFVMILVIWKAIYDLLK